MNFEIFIVISNTQTFCFDLPKMSLLTLEIFICSYLSSTSYIALNSEKKKNTMVKKLKPAGQSK
jgi:hypothetical protein